MHHLCPFRFPTGHYWDCCLPLGCARAYGRNIWQRMRRCLHNPGPCSIVLKRRQYSSPQNSSLFIPCITQLSHVILALDIQQISYDYDLGYGCDINLESRSTRNVQPHEMTVMFSLKEVRRRLSGSYAVWSEITRLRLGISTSSGMIK